MGGEGLDAGVQLGHQPIQGQKLFGGIAGKQRIQHFAVEGGAFGKILFGSRRKGHAHGAPIARMRTQHRQLFAGQLAGQGFDILPRTAQKRAQVRIRGFLLPAGGLAHHHEQQKLLERDAKVAGVVVKEGLKPVLQQKQVGKNAALLHFLRALIGTGQR